MHHGLTCINMKNLFFQVFQNVKPFAYKNLKYDIIGKKNKCEIKIIVFMNKKKRLKWFGHICRKQNTSLVYQNFEQDFPHKRTRGRPPKCWYIHKLFTNIIGEFNSFCKYCSLNNTYPLFFTLDGLSILIDIFNLISSLLFKPLFAVIVYHLFSLIPQ